MGTRAALATLLLVLPALLALAPAATAAHGPASTLLVNLQTGASHGCSPDGLTAPDLDARVWINGQMVGETHKAQDEREARWNTLLQIPSISTPVTFAVEVREAEPGGFLFLGTSWLQCDVNPGAGAWFNVTVGAEGVAFSSQGDGDRAARVTGYAARATAAHPATATLSLVSSTPTALSFSWPARAAGDPTDAQSLEIRWRGESGTLTASATAGTLDGLEENRQYDVRLVRSHGPWRVAAPWATFRTENLPPPPPTLTATAGAESAEVTWRAEAHDLDRIEIHAGPTATFAPDASTLKHSERAVLSSSGTRTLTGLDAGKPVWIKALAVDDRGAANASAAVQVTPTASDASKPTNRVPVVRIEGPEGDLVIGSSLRFRANGSDPDGGPVTYAWSWGDGTDDATGTQVTHAYRQPGTYTVRVVATDQSGGTGDATVTITLRSGANRVPLASLQLSASVVSAGSTLVANATGSVDPDGDALHFVIDWGDGTPPTSTRTTAAHAYQRAGAYNVTLEAVDGRGGTARVVHPVRVAQGQAPYASLSIPTPTVAVNATVTADASASYDPDGGPLRYAFLWGDGAVSEGASPRAVHVYEAPGAYLVHLRVIDDEGDADERRLSLVVTDALPEGTAPTPTTPPPTQVVRPAVEPGPSDRIPGPGALALLAAGALAALALRRRHG